MLWFIVLVLLIYIVAVNLNLTKVVHYHDRIDWHNCLQIDVTGFYFLCTVIPLQLYCMHEYKQIDQIYYTEICNFTIDWGNVRRILKNWP